MADIVLDGRSLTADAVTAVATRQARVALAGEARQRLAETALPDTAVLNDKWLWLGATEPPPDRQALIRAFIETHCGGVGDPLSPSIVRAVLLHRAAVLANGHSGCRPVLVDLLLDLLNEDIVPIVPSQGSTGAAAPTPLAHVARVVLGFGGEAWRDGVRLPAKEALAGLRPYKPTEKEALALINGASLTAGAAALAVSQAHRLLRTAEAACALSMEVVRADPRCLDARAVQARGHPGGIAVAARLRTLLQGSELVVGERRPDPFSIRCTPAVLGAAWDALDHITAVVHRELNGACDNPLVFDGELIETGNFHAAPVALAMDHLKVALTQVASISERRTFRMTYGQLSGLPSFLVPATGLNSGLMLTQYTAASLVSECKGLAHPASVDNIPIVQHREDHVSMGPIAARGALHVEELLADVLAIELMCAAQGLDFHLAGEAVADDGTITAVPPRSPAAGSRAVYDTVRELVDRWTDDRPLHPDLVVLGAAVRDGAFASNPTLTG